MSGDASFQACQQEAIAWLEAHSEWSLLWADEADSQMVFQHQSKGVSFKIQLSPASAPEQGQRHFKIISDDEAVWSLLRDCRGDSISECLTASTKALEPLGGCPEINMEGDDEEEEDIDYGYYDNNEDMMEEETAANSSPSDSAGNDDEITDADEKRYARSGSKFAVHRLLSDLRMFQRSQGIDGIRGSPRGDNLFLWDVQLTDFEASSVLGKDLAKYAKQYQQKPEIHLEMTFPDDYPMSPPFIRVIRPRFKFLTAHVTIGGSICMELLTKSGWRPTNDIEGILVQVRSEITSDPKAGLDLRDANKEYTKTEAETAFRRMVQRYGWNH